MRLLALGATLLAAAVSTAPESLLIGYLGGSGTDISVTPLGLATHAAKGVDPARAPGLRRVLCLENGSRHSEPPRNGGASLPRTPIIIWDCVSDTPRRGIEFS